MAMYPAVCGANQGRSRVLIQNLGYGFPRIPLLGSSVNRGRPVAIYWAQALCFGAPRHESYYHLLRYALVAFTSLVFPVMVLVREVAAENLAPNRGHLRG